MYDVTRQPQVAPNASTPQSAPRSAAPTKSNADTQSGLGLAGAVPASAGSLDGALGALGEMSSVVLDALPLDTALRLLMPHRDESWAREWIRRVPGVQLVEEAGEFLQERLDLAWPVGFGVSAKIEGGAALALELEGEASVNLERTAGGFQATLLGESGLVAEIGGAVAVQGARREDLLGAAAEAGVRGGALVEAMWSFPSFATFARRVGPDLTAAVVSPDPKSLLRALEAVILDAVRTQSPDTWRLLVHGDGTAAGGTKLALPQDALDQGAGLSSGLGVEFGFDGRAAYVEVDLRLGARCELDKPVFDVAEEAGLVDDGSIGPDGAVEMRLRAAGDLEGLRTGDLGDVDFTLKCTTDLEGDRRTDAVGGTLPSLVLWAGAHAQTCLAGPAVAELPDLTLSRSVDREVRDRGAIEGAMPDWMERLEKCLPDHWVMVAIPELRLAGEVRVGRDAVLAALDGAPVASGTEDAATAMVDVQRAIASRLVGGYVYDTGRPLAFEEGVALAEVEKAETMATLTVAMGAGANLSAVGKVEAGGSAETTLHRRSPLPGSLGAEERRALFANA